MGENTEHIFDKNESIILAKMQKDILEMKTKLEEILAILGGFHSPMTPPIKTTDSQEK